MNQIPGKTIVPEVLLHHCLENYDAPKLETKTSEPKQNNLYVVNSLRKIADQEIDCWARQAASANGFGGL